MGKRCSARAGHFEGILPFAVDSDHTTDGETYRGWICALYAVCYFLCFFRLMGLAFYLGSGDCGYRMRMTAFPDGSRAFL
jgi:hypothetical protein